MIQPGFAIPLSDAFLVNSFDSVQNDSDDSNSKLPKTRDKKSFHTSSVANSLNILDPF
jgi:hypothetical protein